MELTYQNVSVSFKSKFCGSLFPTRYYRQWPLVTDRRDIEIGCYVCVAAFNCSLYIYQIIGEFLRPPLIKSLATRVQVQRSMSVFFLNRICRSIKLRTQALLATVSEPPPYILATRVKRSGSKVIQYESSASNRE